MRAGRLLYLVHYNKPIRQEKHWTISGRWPCRFQEHKRSASRKNQERFPENLQRKRPRHRHPMQHENCQLSRPDAQPSKWNLLALPQTLQHHKLRPQTVNIIKQIPISVETRLSNTSCNEEVFKESAAFYENALQRSGYNHKLKFQTTPTPATTSYTQQKQKT